MLSSLLSGVPLTLLEQGYEIGLDWLGKFAQAIIEGVGIIGWGIIVFTLVLKAITLPFDIYQRVKMRKQNLIMKSMQDDLEKLQKQYANDKNMYNQKMMELYKKNGYSMLGACLPMLISLVILIVAFQGFNNYASYANLSMYENMSVVYNEAILEHAPKGIDVYVGDSTDFKAEKPTILWEEEGTVVHEGISYHMQTRTATDGGSHKYIDVSMESDEKFINYSYWVNENSFVRSYFIDEEKLQRYIAADEGRTAEFTAIQQAATEAGISDAGVIYRRYVVKTGAVAAAEWYRTERPAKFLWVKNVWYPDVAWGHPIAPYNKFSNNFGKKKVTLTNGEKYEISAVLGEDQYNSLTAEFAKEKGQANGYFVLIVLSIGLMLLSQWISMRSSKEANKYQTVDGQGANTQKMMLIMMPLIYAIFAFMYSAAFSIYMTVSSAISLIVTLLSNWIIDSVFKKKEAQATEVRYTRKYEWQMTDEEKKQREKEAQRQAKMEARLNRRNRK